MRDNSCIFQFQGLCGKWLDKAYFTSFLQPSYAKSNLGYARCDECWSSTRGVHRCKKCGENRDEASLTNFLETLSAMTLRNSMVHDKYIIWYCIIYRVIVYQPGSRFRQLWSHELVITRCRALESYLVACNVYYYGDSARSYQIVFNCSHCVSGTSRLSFACILLKTLRWLSFFGVDNDITIRYSCSSHRKSPWLSFSTAQQLLSYNSAYHMRTLCC